MKRIILIALACCLCAFTTPAQEQVAPDLRQLTAEVHKLRSELLQHQLEFQEWKLSQLAREMKQLRDEQQRLSDEERSLAQELGALDQQTGGGAVAAQEAVSEAQALRASSDARIQRLRAPGAAPPAADRVDRAKGAGRNAPPTARATGPAAQERRLNPMIRMITTRRIISPGKDYLS
jgi:exonuclease VII large subunit